MIRPTRRLGFEFRSLNQRIRPTTSIDDETSKAIG